MSWRRCEWHEAQQWRERTLTGSIGLEGAWSKWQDGKPGSISGHCQYEYRCRAGSPRPLRIGPSRYHGLYPAERAAKLEDEAQKLGLERPTEGMIQSAINDAVSDVLLWVDGTSGRWYDRYYDDMTAQREEGRT